MCVNGLGHVFVAWIDDRNGTDDLWFNRSEDRGDSWLVSDVKVDRGELSSVFDPEIACDDRYVWLVWEDDRDGELDNHQIYLARSGDFGQSFTTEIVVDDDVDGENMSLRPQIAVDGDRVHVAWYDSRHGAYDILVATSDDSGTTFEPPVRVDADDAGETYSALPSIAAEDGSVYVAWEDSRNGANDIYVACSNDGGRSFGGETRVDTADSPGLSQSFDPIVAVDSGSAHIVWHDEAGSNAHADDIFVTYGGCGAWTPAARVNSGKAGFFESTAPTMQVSGTTAHIAWTDARNSGLDVYYREVRAGAPVGEDVRLDMGDPEGFSNSLEPKLAYNGASDEIIVAWRDGRGDTEYNYDDLYYNHAPAGTPFSSQDLRIDTIGSGESYKTDLQIAIFGRDLLAAWSDGRNGTADVYFHRIPIGEGWIPPAWE